MMVSNNDTKLGQGRNAATQVILDTPELFEEIKNLIRTRLQEA